MTRAVLILNPGSRAGRGRLHWPDWLAALRREGWQVETHQTGALSEARALAAGAHGADLVVAVGGDGTINGVLSGIMDQPEPRPALGVLYAGTSPDFCRFHRIPVEPRQALATLLAGRRKRIDVARVEYRGADGEPRAGWFANSANIGIGARVAACANAWRPRLGDALGTGLALLCALRGPHPRLSVRIDGGEAIELRRCCNLTVAKNPFLASGLRISEDGEADDGRLTLLGVYGRGLAGLLSLVPAFYRGRVSEKHAGILKGSCRSVTIESEEDCAVEFDGDPQGRLPARIEVRPRALNLIVGGEVAVKFKMKNWESDLKRSMA